MNEEILGTIVARVAAQERILTLLLSKELRRCSESEAAVLKAAIDPDGVTPPETKDLAQADDLAGRTIVYRETVKRILDSAQEIAGLTAG